MGSDDQPNPTPTSAPPMPSRERFYELAASYDWDVQRYGNKARDLRICNAPRDAEAWERRAADAALIAKALRFYGSKLEGGKE